MRLTKNMKNKIVSALLEHKFKPLVEKLADEISVYAVDTHAAHFADKLAKMNGLPEGWLPRYDRFNYLNYKDRYFTIYYNGHVSFKSGKEYEETVFGKYSKYDRKGGKFLRHLSSETVIDAKDASNVLDKVIELQKEYEETRHEIRMTLEPFATAEKLIEHWPEVEPFIPEYVPPVKNLPVVQSDALNAKLGLPVTKAE